MYEIYAKLLGIKGVTTAEVCRSTGISQSTMANWKRRKGALSAENASKLADYFEVSVQYLMGQGDEEQPVTVEYYYDKATAEMAQEIFQNQDMRTLFDAARDSKPEDLRRAADLLRRFKETNPDG